MTVEEVKHKAGPILEQHGVAYAGVFGSVARGEERPYITPDLTTIYEEG